VEQVYGKGVQLMTPKPEFAVKSRNTRDGSAAFVNFCSSDKVRTRRQIWSLPDHRAQSLAPLLAPP
jgi:hypothetical protein